MSSGLPRVADIVGSAFPVDRTQPHRRPGVLGPTDSLLGRGRQSETKGPSKQAAVIAMLQRPEGATGEEVASAMGWQRHTVRGLFSGPLKKKLGVALASANEERGRVHRIAEPASA